MFKIKLLILLFTNLFFYLVQITINQILKYFLLHIFLENMMDLFLSKKLKSNLNNFGMLDTNSNYEIQGILLIQKSFYYKY